MTRHEITVSIEGGHQLYRAALGALIESLPGLRVVPPGTIPPPEVLVWDAEPGAPLGTSNQPPNTALLVLAIQSEFDELPPGATGLFSKDETPEALGVAIRQVARGEQYLSPSLALALLQRRLAIAGSPESQGLSITGLTERETEILALLAQGLSNKAIAARLYLSVRTVEGHLANLYPRLGVHSRTEAMLTALR